MKVDADDPKETASLETMPPEVLGQICDELGPNVSAFRLLNKRFAAIGRPYLADRHHRLYLNPTSVARLDGFADDDEWKQRLWELTYKVGDRADPTLPALTGPQYRALEDDMDDNFTDDVHKLARYICYVDWRAEQHDELTQNSTDLEGFVRAMRSLPNLEKVNVEGFSCLDRPLFIPGIEQTLQFPIGLAELVSIVVGAKICLSTNLKELCARNIGQQAFGATYAPTWTTYLDGPPENLLFVTKLSLFLDDEYCRATRVNWSLENLTEVLKLLPNLEYLEFGLEPCSCVGCLGDIMTPPELDRQDRFVHLATSDLSNEAFRIQNLRTIRFVHTRWTGQDLVQFVKNHQESLRSLELEEFELADYEAMSWDEVRAELEGFANLEVLTTTDRPLRVYSGDSDPRETTQYILRRRNGADYRVMNNVVATRIQRGGVLGEEVVLDHW